jgi:hypothetical protein
MKTQLQSLRVSLFAILGFIALLTTHLNAQTVATDLLNNNGSSVVVFSFLNTSSDAILVTEIGSVAGVSATETAHLYVRNVAYNAPTGAPSAITSANGWTLVASNNSLAIIGNTTTNTPQMFISGMSYLVPALTQVQFALQLSSGANQPAFSTIAGNLRYSTIGTQSCNFSNAGCEIRTCDGYGFGGTMAAPTFTPRGFIGYINFMPAVACSGSPSLGSTVGPASVCPNTSFNLGISGGPQGTGVNYVWETSTNGVDFTPAAAAPNAPTWSTSITTATWFRLTATCTEPGGGTSSSTPIQVQLSPVSACYCTSGVGPTSTADSEILSVSITGEATSSINNPTPCPAVTGLRDFTAQSVTLMQGITYDLSVLMGQCGTFGYTNTLKAWIDFNQDGVFGEPSEQLGVLTQIAEPSGSNATFTFTVPFGSETGTTRLRVMMVETETQANVLPCSSFSWGSAHDYTVLIVPNVDCSGTPNPGNTISSAPSVCPGSNFTLSLQNGTAGGGVSYQWQTSSDGASWNNAPGSPNAPTWTTNQFSPTFYRCIVTCTASAESSTSVPVEVLLNNFLACYCTSGVGPTSETFGNLANVNLSNGSETLNNDTPCPAQTSLQNFTNLSIDLAQGEEYTLNFIMNVCGVTSSWNNTLKAWLDYDQSGSFEPGEQLGVVTLLSPPAGIPGAFTFTVPLTAIQGQTRLRIMAIETTDPNVVQPCASFTWGSAHDYTINIVPAPSCSSPTDLTVTNISSDAAVVSWNALAGQNTWEIQYGAPGFTPGQGTSVVTTNNPHNLIGLVDNTSYDVYVRAICAPGDTSVWRGPETFTTICVIYTAPFVENFDGSNWVSGSETNNIGSLIDGCWSRVPNVHTSFSWGTRSGPTPDAGTGPASDKSGLGKYVYTEASVGTLGSVATFTSPAIALTEIIDPYVGFSYFMRGVNIDSLNVFVSNDFGTTWNNLAVIIGQQQTSVNAPWLDTIVSLSAYENDTVMIRFQNIRRGINDDIAIDNFFILPCVGNAGLGGSMDVCILDQQVVLSDIAEIAQLGGQWVFSQNPSAIQNNSIFNVSVLPYTTHIVYYKVQGACADDSLAVEITVYPPSSAGNSNSFVNCNNGFINLFDGLTGTIDLGGQWYNPANVALNSALVQVNGQLSGVYNYYYVTSNGVCPADTSYAEVTLLNCVGISENEIAGFELYPNPTADVVFVSYSGQNLNTTMSLVDAKGSIVFSEEHVFTTNSTIEINMVDLHAGVYFVTIVSDSGRTIIQVVKQ